MWTIIHKQAEMKNIPFKETFEVLQNRDEHFESINKENYPTNIIWAQILTISGLAFCYGLIMGSYNSALQAVSSGLKLCILIFLTLLICFPSFYIVQLVLGSKVKMKQLAIMILSGFLMTTTIMVAFAPIVLFFQLSGDNYHFLQLLHVGVLVFSGFFGMRAVLDALKNSFAESGVYPKIGLNIFRIWVIIFAFVGIQLSWNLRPFVGTKDMAFQIVRTGTQGNFYSTVIGAFSQMAKVKKDSVNETPSNPENQEASEPKDQTGRDSLEATQ